MKHDTFISKIEVGEGHTILKPFSLIIDENTSRDVIITGKNGSGKTTLLNELANATKQPLSKNIHISLLNHSNQYIRSFFQAKRYTNIDKVTSVGAPQINVNINQSPANQFLQYLVNRKTQQAYAISDNNFEEAQEITEWFDNLSKFFSLIFEKKIEFKFNRANLSFTLEGEGEHNSKIDLNKLSDGYSAVISIITDLIIRMEAIKFGDYNQPGIVFIDEIETHLHVSLQRQILPMLQTFFPRIQFIVTTHSPFVLSSVKDAIIYDMEHQERIDQTEGLWNYSYEALIEGYFEVERYSNQLKQDIELYKSLAQQKDLDNTKRKQLRQLKRTLSEVPTYKNPAILRELQTLGLK